MLDSQSSIETKKLRKKLKGTGRDSVGALSQSNTTKSPYPNEINLNFECEEDSIVSTNQLSCIPVINKQQIPEISSNVDKNINDDDLGFEVHDDVYEYEDHPDGDTYKDVEDTPNDILITQNFKDLAAFHAKMGKHKQLILVDSCASATIISEEFWNSPEIQRYKEKHVREYKGGAVRVGDSREQSVIGIGIFSFYIDNIEFKVEGIILRNWAHDVLLSVEWLRRHKCIIDLCMLEETVINLWTMV